MVCVNGLMHVGRRFFVVVAGGVAAESARHWPGSCSWRFALSLFSCVLACSFAAAPCASQPWAVAVFPSGAEFNLEIAADDIQREKGYMFRERVGQREGMLFLFDSSDHHPFWMKNCRTSLDIIWLDERFQVGDIAYDQKPCPEQGACTPVRPMRPARYVLEVAGGTATREGLVPGNRLIILAEPPLP